MRRRKLSKYNKIQKNWMKRWCLAWKVSLPKFQTKIGNRKEEASEKEKKNVFFYYRQEDDLGLKVIGRKWVGKLPKIYYEFSRTYGRKRRNMLVIRSSKSLRCAEGVKTSPVQYMVKMIGWCRSSVNGARCVVMKTN